MSLTARVPALAPFQIRSFRFQWPADLLASWAFEMEGVILGWFVLVSTGSVLALAVFGSLQFLGTLISPLFGMAGDRIGNRNLLCLMRATYLAVAAALAVLFLTGLAAPVPVFVLATVMGLVRPSDITLRNLLVGETMPAELPDAGHGRVAHHGRLGARRRRAVGRGPGRGAGLGRGLCRGLRRLRREPCAHVQCRHPAPARASARRRTSRRCARCAQGFAYVWSTPDMRAVMLLAFLMNFAAYPLVGSLLAYVAKDIYGLDQTGLGWLIACFAGGALAGLDRASRRTAPRIRPARTMLVCAVAVVRPQSRLLLDQRRRCWGEVVLFVAGFVQSFCMIPMAVLLLRVADPAFRGRVMGVRMLAVYGMPLGLLLSGPLVEHVGFAVTGSLFSLVGIVFTAADRAPLARAISGIRRRRPTCARRNLAATGCVDRPMQWQHRQDRLPGDDGASGERRRGPRPRPATRRRRPRPPRTNSATSSPCRSRTTSSTGSARPTATTPTAFASAGCRPPSPAAVLPAWR